MNDRHRLRAGRRAALAAVSAVVAAPALAARRDGRSRSGTVAADTPAPPSRIAREVPIDGEVTVPDRFVGMHFHRWPHGESPAPAFRFGTVRSLNYDPRDNALGVHWAGIHVAPGRFDWRLLDGWVDAHSSAGRDMMYTLYGTPTWASSRPEKADRYGIGGGSSRPRDLRALDEFVRALVARYNGGRRRRIRYLEVWNEPDFPSDYWLDSPSDLAALARVAYTAAKAVDPSLVVVWPGFVNWIAAREPIPRVHRLYLRLAHAPDGAGRRGVDWGDALAVHYYATRADANQFVDHQESVRATRSAIGRPGWDIYLSEIGFEDGFGATVPKPRKIQLIRQWIALSAAYGDRFIGLYSYEDERTLAAPAADAGVARAIDEMHDAVCGRRLRRAALLADGTVWLVRSDGVTLRY